MKRIAVLFLLLPSIGTLGACKGTFGVDAKVSKQFYLIAKESKERGSTLDLAGVNAVDWDELVFWGPYENICDLGISGYSLGKCESSVDDGECYVLFLRKNALVARVSIDRKQIDWAASKLPRRIGKGAARFVFKAKGEWPKIEMTAAGALQSR